MPLDQLEQLVMDAASRVDQAAMAAPAPPAPEHGGPPAPPPAQPGQPAQQDPALADMALVIQPSLIRDATTVMAQQGLISAPTDQLTPEVMSALQQHLQASGDVLVSLTDPVQVREVLQDVAASSSDQPGPGPVGGPGPAQQPDPRAAGGGPGPVR